MRRLSLKDPLYVCQCVSVLGDMHMCMSYMSVCVCVCVSVVYYVLQGIWKPKRTPNPAYFEDEHPFDSLLTITAVGLELWTMSGSIFFDNFLVCSELTIANNFAREG